LARSPGVIAGRRAPCCTPGEVIVALDAAIHDPVAKAEMLRRTARRNSALLPNGWRLPISNSGYRDAGCPDHRHLSTIKAVIATSWNESGQPGYRSAITVPWHTAC